MIQVITVLFIYCLLMGGLTLLDVIDIPVKSLGM